MQNNPMGDLGQGGHSRYMNNSYMQQQPQQQQPGSSFLPQSAPGFPSGFNSGRAMQQPMNGQYNRPPTQQGNSVPLQRAGSTGAVNHRGGLGALGGAGNSIGGVGGQVSLGLSMPGRQGSNMQPNGQQQQGGRGSSSMVNTLSVGSRSQSTPSFGGNNTAFGGSVVANMSGHGGEADGHHPDMAPNFGAEDFPTLGGNMGGSRAVQHEMPMPGVALAAQKLNPDSSFHMANEDFPSLSGGSPALKPTEPASSNNSSNNGFSLAIGNNQQNSGGQSKLVAAKQQSEQASANSSSYGLLGLLNVINMTSADLNTLALGTDLTTLGLNLNSTEPLYSTFASPWADQPCRREPDFSLPMCYYMQPPTLKTGHIQKFQLETLFYIFYMLPKDTLQAVAASELHSRDWKFHSELGMWFCKQPESGKGGFGRPSTYVYFDVKVWERRTYVDNNKNLEQGFLADEEVNVQFSQPK